jgi:hypothetical protein
LDVLDTLPDVVRDPVDEVLVDKIRLHVARGAARRVCGHVCYEGGVGG